MLGIDGCTGGSGWGRGGVQSAGACRYIGGSHGEVHAGGLMLGETCCGVDQQREFAARDELSFAFDAGGRRRER